MACEDMKNTVASQVFEQNLHVCEIMDYWLVESRLASKFHRFTDQARVSDEFWNAKNVSIV